MPTYRKGEFYRAEIPVDNTTSSVYYAVTNLGVLNNGSNPDIVTTTTGNSFIPKTPENFTYDADGNLTQDGRWTYVWDAENRLISMVALAASGPQQINFEYDWQGRRIRKQVWNSTKGIGTADIDQRFIYDGWNLISVVDASAKVVATYGWGLDLSGTLQGAGGVGGLLWVGQASGGNVTNYHFAACDGNGNVAAFEDSSSQIASAQYDYDPFGRILRCTGVMATNNPFRFSTKFTDNESDMVYYGYRYYNPSTGRWLSRDPIEEKGGLNLYGFVRNDSVNNFELLGLLFPDGGYTPPPKYDPPDAGKPCCTTPATLKKAKRTDPPPTVLQRVGGATTWMIHMQLDLEISGPYKDLKIYWTTCWRTDGNSGAIGCCEDSTSCEFSTITGNLGGWPIGGPYVTTARVWWLSCENGVWTKKKKIAGGGYTFDGTWHFQSE